MADIAYTVRLAPELLERIEKTARERGISPRRLIRAILAEFAGDSNAQRNWSVSPSHPQRGLDQILFDLTRARLTLQHLLDHQVGSEITDQIRKAAQSEAERYMQSLGRRGRA